MTVPDVLQDASNFHNDTDKLMSAINVGIGHQLKMYSANAPAGVCRNMWCTPAWLGPAINISVISNRSLFSHSSSSPAEMNTVIQF